MNGIIRMNMNVWSGSAIAAVLLLSTVSTVLGSSTSSGRICSSQRFHRLRTSLQRKHDNNEHYFAPSAAPTNEVTVTTSTPSDISISKYDPGTYNIVGLQNLGNTCYLNAQIQCVYHIPLIRKWIVENLDAAPTVSHSEESSSTAAYIGLRKLFIDMNESIYGRAVSPTLLCQLLDIPVYEQQDAQEFWKLLLPALQQPNIMELYTGTYENYIVALDGSNRERRFLEPFLDLSLDLLPSTLVPETTSNPYALSILDSLRQQFNQSELLSVATGNGWCPSVDAPEKVDAHKGYQLTRHGLPSILQLHLKRFQFDWNTETTNKLNHAVTFPLMLDLSAIVAPSDDDDDVGNNDDCIYELQSVLVHVGEYQSGHYYSYVRPNVRTDDWYRFNDEIHTKVRFADVIHDAYGGSVSSMMQNEATNMIHDQDKKRNRVIRFFRDFFGMDGINTHTYGFGGPKSNAYVLQYICRKDIPKLYDLVTS
jgi:ubiquitin C-terminal hydrolase